MHTVNDVTRNASQLSQDMLASFDPSRHFLLQLLVLSYRGTGSIKCAIRKARRPAGCLLFYLTVEHVQEGTRGFTMHDRGSLSRLTRVIRPASGGILVFGYTGKAQTPSKTITLSRFYTLIWSTYARSFSYAVCLLQSRQACCPPEDLSPVCSNSTTICILASSGNRADQGEWGAGQGRGDPAPLSHSVHGN